jgi:4-hydroxy-tetrahydrodipicolinate synthase
VLLRHPDFAIFPGSESYLLDASRAGAAGCISGTVALWPLLARDAFAGDRVQMERLEMLRRSLDPLPMIPAVRYLVAKERNDESWMRPMPPLLPLSDYDRELADNLAVHV